MEAIHRKIEAIEEESQEKLEQTQKDLEIQVNFFITRKEIKQK